MKVNENMSMLLTSIVRSRKLSKQNNASKHMLLKEEDRAQESAQSQQNVQWSGNHRWQTFNGIDHSALAFILHKSTHFRSEEHCNTFAWVHWKQTSILTTVLLSYQCCVPSASYTASVLLVSFARFAPYVPQTRAELKTFGPRFTHLRYFGGSHRIMSDLEQCPDLN